MEEAHKGRVVRTIDIDFNNLEQTFLFPNLFHVDRWINKEDIKEIELRLEFVPGIYLLSEFSFDDSDLGVFNLEYIDRLIELDKQRRAVDWSAPAAVINKRSLRPVPDIMLDYLNRNSSEIDFDFSALANSFLTYLEEQTSLKLMSNESYGLLSSSSDSLDEFRQVCMDHANSEKSERAMELGAVYDRKIQQMIGSLQKDVHSEKGPKQEVALTQIGDLGMACASLLNKAINMHIVEPHIDQSGIPEAGRYRAKLEEEKASLIKVLERFQDEFLELFNPLIDEFSALEQEVNEKANNISTVEVPLAKCTIQLLRVSHVWLPYWRAEYSRDGREESKMFKAF